MMDLYKTLIAVSVGFLLSQTAVAWDRRRKLRCHWSALRAELRECDRKAQVLRTARIGAPLYRLLTVAYETAFPLLLGEGAVSEVEYSALSRCYDQLADINRGLENANLLRSPGDTAQLADEYQRLCQKANALLDGEADQPAILGPALHIVNAKASARVLSY